MLEIDVPPIVAFEAPADRSLWSDILDNTNPLLYMAVNNNPDVLTYAKAMRAPDCDKFIKAMEKEIENFGKRKF